MSTKARGVAALALLGIVFAAAALSLLRLQIDNAPEVYFAPHAPAVVFDRELREQFPGDQILLLLFRAPDMLSTERLVALHGLATALARHPNVERVLTLTTFDQISGTEDGFAVEPLVDPAQLRQDAVADYREQVLADRFAPGLLVSEDASHVALAIRPNEADNSLQRLALYRAAHRAVADAGLSDALVAAAGQIALDVAQLRSMVRDSLIFIPATSAMGLILIWWLFRRPLAVAFAGLALATMVSLAVAVVALWGRPYTLASSILPPLLAALTSALLVHVYTAMYHAAQRGLRGAARVESALDDVRRPALYSSLTTAAGLLSLALSPIQPVATFGIAGAIAVLFLYPLVAVVVPPVLVAFDRSPWPRPRGLGHVLHRTVDAMARLATRRAGWVIAVTVIGIALASPLLWRVQAETDLYRFFRDDHPLTQSTRLVESELAGVSQLEIVFDAPARDALKAPERLMALRRVQGWLEGLPQVDRTFSMAELIEEMHWAFNGEDPRFRTIPDSGPLISQYLLIYDGDDLYELVNRDFTRTRLAVNLNVHGANQIQKVIDRVDGYLRDRPAADLTWRFAGTANLFAAQEDLLVKGQIRSLWGALVLIFALMAIMWRSAGAGALCMIPNIAPVWLIFVIMGATGIRLDMATAMIASVAVGIAVDDTIHVYEGVRRRVRAGSALSTALVRTYRQAGRAVGATTVLLCAQFLLLASSAFVPTMQFGVLSAAGLAAALLFDLLLLPALIVALARHRRGSVPVP